MLFYQYIDLFSRMPYSTFRTNEVKSYSCLYYKLLLLQNNENNRKILHVSEPGR